MLPRMGLRTKNHTTTANDHEAEAHEYHAHFAAHCPDLHLAHGKSGVLGLRIRATDAWMAKPFTSLFSSTEPVGSPADSSEIVAQSRHQLQPHKQPRDVLELYVLPEMLITRLRIASVDARIEGGQFHGWNHTLSGTTRLSLSRTQKQRAAGVGAGHHRLHALARSVDLAVLRQGLHLILQLAV